MSKWNSGPPPHVGWWNASVSRDRSAWRWWDGLHWSMAARPWNTAAMALRWAGKRYGHDALIEWTHDYPAGARVPRIAPPAGGTAA